MNVCTKDPIIIPNDKLPEKIPDKEVTTVVIQSLSIFLYKAFQSPVFKAMVIIIPIIAGIGIFSIVFPKNNTKSMKNIAQDMEDSLVFDPFSKLNLD